MQSLFMLSPVYTGAQGQTLPVAADYASSWVCPRFPDAPQTQALVWIETTPQQLAAAAQDARLTICPSLGSLAAPASVVASYATWGTAAGMSMDELIGHLATIEPAFLSCG